MIRGYLLKTEKTPLGQKALFPVRILQLNALRHGILSTTTYPIAHINWEGDRAILRHYNGNKLNAGNYLN